MSSSIFPAEVLAVIDTILPLLLDFLLELMWIVLILLIGRKLIKMIIKTLEKVMEKTNFEPGIEMFLLSLAKYGLYIVLAMIVLSKFGVTASSVVAVIGSAGLTIGLALQGSLSNFAGGVLILILKPFVVGDYIIEQGGGLEGTVKEITIFYTKLTTGDNRVVWVPNGTLSNSSIINTSMMSKRRLDIEVSVAYNSNLAQVKSVLYEIIHRDEAILENEPSNVFVSMLGDSSIKMGVRLWVKKENYWDAKWRITENIKLEFDKNNIEIPFPQMDVNLKK